MFGVQRIAHGPGGPIDLATGRRPDPCRHLEPIRAARAGRGRHQDTLGHATLEKLERDCIAECWGRIGDKKVAA